MTRRPAPTASLRIGLKWRDGRPRWEPSPAARAAGLAGMDLKDLAGAWLDRGEAMAVAEARARWATAIREALRPGPAGEDARQGLSAALDALRPPQDDPARQRRALLADLIARAGQVAQGPDAPAIVGAGPRTIRALTEAYFADPKIQRDRAAATLVAYRSQAGRLDARFGDLPAARLTRRMLMDWYEDELLETLTVSTANLCMGATAAFLKWAWDKEWILASPAVKLGLRSANGRRVFWTLEDERTFARWCDAHGFADVADGVVAGLWTGARIGDVCAANLEDLRGEVWRFTPEKTRRKGQEAMPAIMPALRARIDRREQDVRRPGAAPRFLAGTPFLWNPRTQRRHNTTTFGHRYREARALFVAAGQAPAGFELKRTQDTRDTCITRLFLADVPISRMWTWTGHAQKSIEQILKDHYIVLREEGALQLAAKLAAWAEKEGLAL